MCGQAWEIWLKIMLILKYFPESPVEIPVAPAPGLLFLSHTGNEKTCCVPPEAPLLLAWKVLGPF